uniref:Glycolipid transfer protein domain-containing protein n=1 Tax=Vitis vinifera TaxID=29760 RepID=A5AP40_VITVI|nr:hypothetical protein VITISV_036543 [Vitis vinifera]
MEKGSEIRSAIEELSMVVKVKTGEDHDAAVHVQHDTAHIPTRPFLSVCNSILQVLDKIGPTMAVLRQDVHQNIQHSQILNKSRSMDFMAALLQRLAKDPRQSMEQAVEESYSIALKPWHGWISSAAFKVALKLVPDDKTFITLLLAKDENLDTLQEEMQALTSLLVPFLEEIHSILGSLGLDRLKAT